MVTRLPDGTFICQSANCHLALAAVGQLANSYAMANRIRELRKARRITLEDLADSAGISTTHLSRMETGERGLSLEYAVRIARALSCEVVDLTSEFSEDDIEAARRLELPEKSAAAGDIANLNIHAGMGNGGLLSIDGAESGFVPSHYTEGYWTFPDPVKERFRHINKTHALPVLGDSMSPTLRDGAIVFVDTTHTVPSPPDIYVVDYGDGLMVKRVELIPRSEKVRIISDNSQHYPSYELSREDVRVFGRVVASFQWRG